MGSGITRIDIWNHALDLLREQPLAAVTDDDAVAQWLTRNYAQQRDYLLGNTYLWKFAVSRETLAADPTAPAWGWSTRYLIPTDALRIIPPTNNGAWDGTPIPFEQEDGYLLCDVTDGLRLRYIVRKTIEGEFTNGFCEVLAARLAARAAHWMTGKQSMAQELKQGYLGTLNEVKQVEAVQVAAEHYYDTAILSERIDYW